ncbi:unnamed protein product, partial [Oikopleura dioica]
ESASRKNVNKSNTGTPQYPTSSSKKQLRSVLRSCGWI